jgi:phosphate transport system protein
MKFSGHTTTAFDPDLQSLAQLIAEMGGLAERQIVEAIQALIKRDGARGQRVIAADAAIDFMQRAIEERAIELIARRQPMAADLREVVAILRIANELERIGDLAKNIAKRVVLVDKEQLPRRSMRGLNHMATLMLAQLRDVLDSLAHSDVGKAMDVWRHDEDVDRLCASLFQEVLTAMMEDPGTITLGIHLLFCIKNLERMADHATNIAESVYYLARGETLTRAPKPDVNSMPALALSSY